MSTNSGLGPVSFNPASLFENSAIVHDIAMAVSHGNYDEARESLRDLNLTYFVKVVTENKWLTDHQLKVFFNILSCPDCRN